MEQSLETRACLVMETEDRLYTPVEARQFSPLLLAWIGDSEYSTMVRRYLISRKRGNVDSLNRASIRFVRAEGQATALNAILPELTEEERIITKNGRNVKSHVPKNAKTSDYRLATGLECLFGFLSLTGNRARLETLMSLSIAAVEEKEKKEKLLK